MRIPESGVLLVRRMTRVRAAAVLLVAALVLCPAAGAAGPLCASCCPVSDGKVPTLSDLACCGEDCGEKLASGQERPCLTSVRVEAAKAQALPVTLAPMLLRSGAFGFPHPLSLWLPAAARPGTHPLRL
jgi:hypothetical protein